MKLKLPENPVLAAIANGDFKALARLTNQKKNMLLDIYDKEANGPLMTAIRYGQLGMLHLLVRSKEKGGYGLSFDERNFWGQSVVIKAITENQEEILDVLVSQDGYGLSMSYVANNKTDVIETAIFNDRLKILLKLLRPVEEGGYGCKINNIDHYLKFAQRHKRASAFVELAKHYYYTLAKHTNNSQLLWSELQWLRVIYLRYKFAEPEMRSSLKDLIKFFIKRNDEYKAMTVVKMIEQSVPGEGNFFLASIFEGNHEYLPAFYSYRKVFRNKQCPLSKEAGIRLAEMHLRGDIAFNSKHTIDRDITTRRGKSPFSSDELSIRKQEGNDLFSLQQRAMWALPYLEGNNSEDAERLRQRIYQILCGNKTPLINPPPLTLSLTVLTRLHNHYAVENPTFLERDRTMLAYIFDEKLSEEIYKSEQAKGFAISSHAQFFSAGKNQKIEQENPVASNSVTPTRTAY